ncbi:hypothetical protein EV424DRAFT_194081 [Suillus variegatus]|nr:hypothetical protein EV424DRAFT_194081 [Suillus variegatus]
MYLPTDGFDAGPPFSRTGTQDHILTSVVCPRYPQRVSHSSVPQSQPQTHLCRIPPNVLQKRKRQRDSLPYPNALHYDSETGDSLPRRPRKRRMLSLKLSSSSSSTETLSDIAITEARDSAVTKNYGVRSTRMVTPDICITNTPTDDHTLSAPRDLTPPFKAVSKHQSQGSSLHCSLRNDHGHKKAVDTDCDYEHTPEYTLTANDTSSVTCLKDSPPVLAIDFTRLQFPSRNRSRFPLLHLEPVAAIAKVGSREDGESSTRPVASNHTLKQFAQDVPPVTQQPGNSVIPGTCSSENHENTETVSPVTRRGTRVGSSSSPRRLDEAIDSRHDTVTYHMDQLIRTRKRATARDDVRFATLWESNAMWKGMRFWHENVKKPTWNADM